MSNEELTDKVNGLIKDKIRKCIAVNVYNAIYVDKEKCDSQAEFSEIVKKATQQVVPVEFTDGVMKMTLEEFERESIASGDVTAAQLDEVKSGNFRFVLRFDYNNPEATIIVTARNIPSKEKFARLTDHFKYGCDAGSLVIVVDGRDYMLQNCTGDGEGTVYITDKDHFSLPSPFREELILSFGSYDADAPSIDVGLRRFDIVVYMEPRMILRGKHYSISRVLDTKDFVIRVKDLKILRRPKSDHVGNVFSSDEYEDCEQEGGTSS